MKLTSPAERELIAALHTAHDVKRRQGGGYLPQFDRGALNSIGAVDDQSMTIEVQASALLSEVEAVLNGRGLSLGPLPPAAWADLATVSSYLEGPYASLRSVPGGRLESICAHVEGVFADGKQFRSSPGPRSAAGPDLASLFYGASGRLGLVTSARLRAFAKSESASALVASFETPREAVHALTTALVNSVVPARVQLSLRESKVVARIEWPGTRENVERDRDVLHRVMPNIDLQPAPAFVAQGLTCETTWPVIEAALRRVRRLELHRLSLSSVIAIGDVEGMRLDRPGEWSMPGAAKLAETLDAAKLLGGAP